LKYPTRTVFEKLFDGRIQLKQKAFQREAPDIIRLAAIEELRAHAGSLKVR
jgi:histidinol dehydrogenase